MAGLSHEPGSLGRVGAITPSQACLLAGQASNDPGTDWRVIVTSTVGQALAVTRIPRTGPTLARAGPTLARAGPTLAPAGSAPAPARSAPTHAGRGGQRAGPFSTWTGLVGRVTLTIPEDVLAATAVPETAAGPGILASALNAAAVAAKHAAAQAAADLAAGGCAHTAASPAYRPPPRLREYVTARDVTCRFPYCRQPAWRGDLDHTRPYENGGLTCRCNLGGLCRFHHILKQHPDWQLTQLSPGIFQWTTPSGRTYLATPDTHLV